MELCWLPGCEEPAAEVGLGLCRSGWCHGAGHSCPVIARSPSGTTAVALWRHRCSLTVARSKVSSSSTLNLL